jgi:quinol monooxygenase YgiN
MKSGITMLDVCVIFRSKQAAEADFMQRAPENARTSLAPEERCHRVDVASDGQRSDPVFLYEFATGRAEFDTHPADPPCEAETRRNRGRTA